MSKERNPIVKSGLSFLLATRITCASLNLSETNIDDGTRETADTQKTKMWLSFVCFCFKLKE